MTVARRGEGEQRLADVVELGELRGARIAPRDVRADGDFVRDRELAIVKCLQAPARGRAAQVLHKVLASRSSARSDWRARASRDLTVPRSTPSENAISS